jgi:methionyl-tRNA formyltransferase
LTSKPISIFFFGSPSFAVPSLIALSEEPRILVECVVTQTDQKAGRGLALKTPEAGIKARELGIPLFQPHSLKSIDWIAETPRSTTDDSSIKDFCNFIGSIPKPDFIIVVAYGKILPEALLAYPQNDCLNVHPSLLPRWRGAAPLQRTLLDGDTTTGVCIMRLVKELDAGPVYKKEIISISSDTNLADLHDELSHKGAILLKDTILAITDKGIEPAPQSSEGVTYAEKWMNEESIINWKDSAIKIHNRIRACSPRPGARTLLEGKDFKILSAAPLTGTITGIPEETGILFHISKNRIGVRCGEGTVLELKTVQLAGKKQVHAEDFSKGLQIASSIKLGS